METIGIILGCLALTSLVLTAHYLAEIRDILSDIMSSIRGANSVTTLNSRKSTQVKS